MVNKKEIENQVLKELKEIHKSKIINIKEDRKGNTYDESWFYCKKCDDALEESIKDHLDWWENQHKEAIRLTIKKCFDI